MTIRESRFLSFARRTRFGVVLCLLGLLPVAASAAELFRYRNADGVVVLANTIPAEFEAQGYTVIDHRGRVIRVVPRQLTDAELRQQAEEEAAANAAAAERLAQREQDEELLRLYSTPEDVQRALERKVESIEGAIDTVRASIQRLLSQRRSLMGQAAEIERAGQAVPARILSGIRTVDSQIEEREAEIEAREAEILATREDFAADRERLRYLLGLNEDA